MTEADFTILDVGFALGASKRRSYRDGVVSHCRALVEFLQDHGLTTRRLLEPGEIPDASFRLMKSDLTEEGYELMKHGHDKWVTQTENPIEDVSILERELQLIRMRNAK